MLQKAILPEAELSSNFLKKLRIQKYAVVRILIITLKHIYDMIYDIYLPFFKKGLAIDKVFTHGRCFPRKVRSRWIALEEIRFPFIPTTYQ